MPANAYARRMPGERLNLAERRRIAEALAEGRSYAAIARELGRPKSTVSREVLRNGGPGRYDATRAHADTAERARRSGPIVTRRAPDTPMVGRDARAVRGFVDTFNELLVSLGMSRMTARILTCLYTTDTGSLTAAELVAWLKVSPASVSTAVGFLEGQGLLRRERGEGRRERYVVDDDVWLHAMVETARQNRILAEAARDGVEAFGRDTPTGERLRRFGKFLGRVSDDLMASIERSLADAGADGGGGEGDAVGK